MGTALSVPAQTQSARVRAQGSGHTIQTAITIISIVLVGIALIPALVQMFLDKPLYYPDARFTIQNIVALVSDREVTATFGATFLFCSIVVLVSMALGTSSAILIGRTDLPGRSAFLAILLWPLFLSPQVIGFGAILAYGPAGLLTIWFSDATGLTEPWNLYSVPGMAVVAGIAATPVTTLYCLTAAIQQDPNQEAAARIAGAGSLRILFRIILPIMRPALIFAFIMNIVNALETLAIPLIIGGPVGIKLLTTLIYDKSFESAGLPQYGLVSALAFALMAIVGVLFFLQRLALRQSHRFVSVGAKSIQPKMLALGSWKWPAFLLMAVYVVFGVVVLVGAVFARSLTFILSPDVSFFDAVTLQHYSDVLSVEVYRRSILNTLLLAVVGGALGTAFVAAVAMVAQRSNYRYRRVLDAVAQLPRVLPGLVVGLGVFYASMFVPGIDLLRNTIWLVLIAYLIRFLSSGYGIVSPALLQITGDFDRAAKSVGAGWTTTMTRIVLPLSKQALLSCFVLLMILIIKEYSSAVFLMAPGSEVIGSTMLSLWTQGLAGPVAALAVMQIVLTSILTSIVTRILGVKLHG
ncbi:iron(III) transport system permease protein [Xaviernesmea oryzae]|uniref:Iron(III) transport system permease protein n=1 Tax=Xaviernesmea oryzae TaxID=464029 RepID=A0A1X7FPP0_9HYPH|nr:iron ABC transporter permease [Xaviernesmea oryzae]SMF56360.1 iron(III) transport system permease protein [Xaviernesmea oryzae]